MKEVERLRGLVVVESGVVSRETAALQMGLGNRQLKRLRRRLREEDPAGLRYHRRRGPANNTITTERRDAMMTFVGLHFADFGPTLATEMPPRGCSHEAQPLQGGVIEQTVAAHSARHGPQQSVQQDDAHNMHAHSGIRGSPGYRVGLH